MTKIKVGISVEMPKQTKPEYEQLELLDKVQDYMFVCQSDEDSEYHYNYLKCLYKKLKECKGKLKDEHLLIVEILEKFFRELPSVADGDDFVDLEGSEFFKHNEEGR